MGIWAHVVFLCTPRLASGGQPFWGEHLFSQEYDGFDRNSETVPKHSSPSDNSRPRCCPLTARAIIWRYERPHASARTRRRIQPQGRPDGRSEERRVGKESSTRQAA